MFAVDTVLAPFDFSPRCRAGVRHAVELANRLEARLEIVHVTPRSSSYAAFEGGAYIGLAWPKLDEVRDKLDEELARIEELKSAVAPWSRTVIEGDPPARIREIAEAAVHPLLVLPTHGYGRFRRFVFGSVANKLLHDLSCPILTGAHLEDAPAFVDVPYRRILCALDLRPPSHDILPWAKGLAAVFGAQLDVVHAIDVYEKGPVVAEEFTPRLRQGLIDSARSELDPLLLRHGITGDSYVEIGAPEEYIPRLQSRTGADLLVIGRGMEHGIASRLWGKAYDLIRASATAVVSV